MSTRSRRAIGAALAVVALFTAACGDDEDDAADDTSTTAAPEDGAAVELSDDWCVAWEEIVEYLDGDEADAEGIEARFTAFAELAPAGAAQGSAAMQPSLVRALTEGDFFGMLSDAEFGAGFEQLDADLVEECGLTDLTFTAVDWAYSDAPATLPAGEYLVDLENEGTELHEAIIFRLADDESRPIGEVLAELAESEDAESVGEAFAVPGMSGLSDSTTLEAGRYVVACFIPVGLTPDVAQAAEEGGPEPEGPPHYEQGMFAELTVE